MIYYNKTNYKIYYYGNIINPYTLFRYNYVNVFSNNIKKNLQYFLQYVFLPANGNEEYYEECKKFISVKFTHLKGIKKIVINNDIISIDEFNKKYINFIFDKNDLIIINSEIEYYEDIL
jgi:hypothetical protein